MLKLLRNNSIGNKIALLSGFLFASFLILSVSSYRGFSVLQKRQGDIVNELYAVRNISLADMLHEGLLAIVYRTMLAAETNNKSEDKEILEQLRESSNNFKTYLNNIDALPLNQNTKNSIAKTRPALDAYVAAAEEIVNLALTGRREEAFSKLPKFKGTFENLEQELDKLGDIIEQDVKNSVVMGRQTAITAKQTSGIVIVATLFFGIVLSLFISRIITASLRQVLNTITASSTEIAATAEQQERTVSQQAASVNQTTITMEELGASSQQSAEQAEASAAGAHQALTLAEGGTLAVQQTMDGMVTLKEKVEAIAEQILRLSEQTDQIGSVSGLVGDLANQTNMLALNAAVEAARAGEHGRGFGVVAGEIRKLADQSKKSAQKINALVTDIQAAINTTVMVTDEGTKKVDEGMKLAQGTAETFTGVAESINNVFLNSQQISLNAKQQALAVQQVVEAMNSINSGARESTSGVTQVRASTQQLNAATHKLKALV